MAIVERAKFTHTLDRDPWTKAPWTETPGQRPPGQRSSKKEHGTTQLDRK